MRTIGEKRLRVDLSSETNNDKVVALRRKTAEIINALEEEASILRQSLLGVEGANQHEVGEVIRLISLAQTQYETASMYATKALTA